MMTNRRWNSKLPTMASILQDHQCNRRLTAGGFMAANLGFLKGFDLFNETNLTVGPILFGPESSDAARVH
jgi:hypothetical protein